MDWTVLAIAVVAAIGAFIGAYFSERGKIRAQTNALESIVKQEAAKAAAQEGAKQLAIAENLRNLDLQMRTLTTTQEQIKAQLSGELWHRQVRWNQKRDLYIQLFECIDQLWDLHHEHSELMKRGTETLARDSPKIDEVNEKIAQAYSKLVARATLSIIFLNLEAQDALRWYEEESLGFRDPWLRGKEMKENLMTLKRRLIKAAKDDLGFSGPSHEDHSDVTSKPASLMNDANRQQER